LSHPDASSWDQPAPPALNWLDAVRRLQALAQSGLTYVETEFERERWEEVRAVAAALGGGLSGEDAEELVAGFAAEAGHATPKVDVRGVVFRGEEILLVRGLDDGLWTMPGGWAEVGESPRAAAEKELREESGYRGRAAKLIGVYERDARDRPRFPFHAWKLYFLCELEPGEPAPPQASEITEVGFFAPDELPELSQRTPSAHLADVFAHARDPARPTDFD
jgi:ADP-ribose pyrophosphatase YjhB (NUDIX family)